MARKRWTAEDDARLTALYVDHSARECAEMLGCSHGAVTARVDVLGLKKALFLPVDHDRAADADWGDPSAYERTVGIVGLSTIGRGVAQALPRLLPSVRLVAYDPYATAENTTEYSVIRMGSTPVARIAIAATSIFPSRPMSKIPDRSE